MEDCLRKQSALARK